MWPMSKWEAGGSVSGSIVAAPLAGERVVGADSGLNHGERRP